MARQEAAAVRDGVRLMNQHLLGLVPGRTLQSIKGVRRRQNYKDFVQRALQELTEEAAAQQEEPPAVQQQLQSSSHPIVTVHTPPSAASISTQAAATSSPATSQPPTTGDSSWQIGAVSASRVVGQQVESPFVTAVRNLLPHVQRVRGWRTLELSMIASSLLDGADPRTIRLSVGEWFFQVFPPPQGRNSLRPARRVPEKRISKRAQRRREYAAVQRLFRKNMSGCVRSVLDGVSISEPPPMPDYDDMVRFWTEVVSQPSKEVVSDGFFPSDPLLAGVWGAVSEREVGSSRVPGNSAPGPDGVSARLWGAVPRAVQALLFNLVLYAGGFPTSMLASRTVFVPKKGGTGRPSDFRPISVTSVVVRHLHKVLAERLHKLHLSDIRQRAFDDGCSELTSILASAIHNARSQLQALHFVSLDVAKAFDSVSHAAVLLGVQAKGLPAAFCSYIENLYASSATQFQLHGRSSPLVNVTRGVRQGDPLSSLLFSFVVDLVLKELPADVGIRVGAERLGAFAYADDVLLFASTIWGLQTSLRVFEQSAGRFGLDLNADKTFAFSLAPHSRRKTFKMLDGPQVFLGSGRAVGQVNSLSRWNYLGVEFAPDGPSSTCERLTLYLERLTRGPLKPQQRLVGLRSFLLPRLYHSIVLGKCNSRKLHLLDLQVRSAVRKWLRLPRDTPLAFFHANVRDGGLGVPSLSITVPALLRSRLLAMERSRFPVARAAFRTQWIQSRLEFTERVLHPRGSPTSLFTRSSRRRYWSRQLYDSVDGAELREASNVPASTSWLAQRCLQIPGRQYVNYIRTWINALPSAVRTSRGRRQDGVPLCRAGCQLTETTAHCIQMCHRTHGGRILRHDAVAKTLAVNLQRRGFVVSREPVFQTAEGRRKPDILVHRDGVARMLDVQVVSGGPSLRRTHESKVGYYNNNPSLIQAVAAATSCTVEPTMSATLTWRGVWSSDSAAQLHSLGVTCGEMAAMTTRVLQGSHMNFANYMKMTSRRGRGQVRERAGIG
jgi:hypothetical protein